MTTTATMQGIELEYGTPDNLEVKVLTQLRAQREVWDAKQRPYMLSFYIDPVTNTVYIFAGHPAGRVRE